MELRNGYSDLELKAPANLPPSMTYLHPGQMAISADPKVLMTILGSCVAVCLWDPIVRAGGMVHYLLPRWEPTCGERTPRYGNVAIEALIDKMKGLGSRPSLMQARVFGGGCVLKAFRQRGKEHLGSKNAELAERLLADAGIRIVECDTLGNMTRKVAFYTETGLAEIKHVGDSDGL